MGSSEQSARRSSPGTVSSATAVSGTPSCRSRMPSPSAMSVSWRKRRKPWNGSGHRQEPKSWALHSFRQRESRARKTAKYALLTRGRAGVWERAAHAEGSNTTPVSLMRNLLLFWHKSKGKTERMGSPLFPRLWRVPLKPTCSIKAQDKERWSQSDPSRPQSPAVRGFPRMPLRGRFRPSCGS